jgi:hypothetical protein
MAVIVFMLLAQHPGADLHLRRRHRRLVGIAAAALALALAFVTTGIAFGLASYFGTLAKAARSTEQRVPVRCRPVGALAACLGFGGALSVRTRDGRGVVVCVFIGVGVLGCGLAGATTASERSRESGGSVHGVLEFDDCVVQVGELAAGVRVHGDEGSGCGEEVAECRGCAGCIGRGRGAAGRCSDGGGGRSGRLLGTGAGRGGAGALVRAFVGVIRGFASSRYLRLRLRLRLRLSVRLLSAVSSSPSLTLPSLTLPSLTFPSLTFPSLTSLFARFALSHISLLALLTSAHLSLTFSTLSQNSPAIFSARKT